jgi:ATP-dependent RNA helicase DBP3
LHKPVHITVGSDELTANKRITQVVEVFENTREKE